METKKKCFFIFAFFVVCSATSVVCSGRPTDDDSIAAPRQSEEGRSLDSELRWLKEKTAELALVADKVKADLISRTNSGNDQVKKTRVNKRHCWDVADVCCMWNIC